MNNTEIDQYRSHFKSDLARLIGCEPDSIPASVSKDIAVKFLGLKNEKTLNVWSSAGRHGIVMIKVGKVTQPSTQWLIDLKLAGIKTAGEAA